MNGRADDARVDAPRVDAPSTDLGPIARRSADADPVDDAAEAMGARLRAAATAARVAAYAPYSRFAVGAAVATADGAIVAGCNVENASYGLTLCAERVAVGAAVAAGARRLVGVAVRGDAAVAVTPCGACRQVLAEFAAPATPVWCLGPGGWRRLTLADLLPHAFALTASPPAPGDAPSPPGGAPFLDDASPAGGGA